jgi:hypothetical protein
MHFERSSDVEHEVEHFEIFQELSTIANVVVRVILGVLSYSSIRQRSVEINGKLKILIYESYLF